MTAASPQFIATSSMGSPRYNHTMVVLPDGKVLAVGGASITSQTTTTNVTLTTEEWDPATGNWTQLPNMAEARIYHSTAILMPDGRVIVAGGGRFNSAADHLTAQYYSPNYLFTGPRPTIGSAPASAGYGAQFSVQTPDAATVTGVSLVA